MHRLAKEIKEGDLDAFNLFYKSEYNNLMFFVNNYLKDHDASKDIVQDSFIAFWEKRAYIKENKNIRSYIFQIARNKTINLLKSKSYSANSRQSLEIIAEIKAISNSYVTERIDSLSLEELIRKTYDNLPKTVKPSFRFSRYSGHTNAEIAKKLGISVRTVEHHIATSLKIFKKKLKNYL